jgi:hypothetical protein
LFVVDFFSLLGNSEATKLLLDQWKMRRDRILESRDQILEDRDDVILNELEDYSGNTLISWLIMNGKVRMFVSVSGGSDVSWLQPWPPNGEQAQ